MHGKEHKDQAQIEHLKNQRNFYELFYVYRDPKKSNVFAKTDMEDGQMGIICQPHFSIWIP